ncbi:MAG TPA: ABC transporter permease [Thermoanaerobaculia bacterium]|nr:ABC transporter permease [Thermoanaerobaculia bacterium]
MDTLWQDFRIGLRTLFRAPSFLVAAVLVLASGIGATIAVFSCMNAFVLNPLSLPDADRVAQLWEADLEEGGRSEVAAGNFLDWRRQSESFDGLAAYWPVSLNLTSRGEPERIPGAMVSADFFRVLGVQPAHGRDFLAAEDAPGAPGAAIISHDLWRRRLDAAPGALGRSYIVNGQPYTLVGVLPPDFHLPHLGRADIWVPLVLDAEDAANRTYHWLYVLGRLKPGVSRDVAQAEIETIAKRLAAQHPRTNARIGARVVPLQQEVTRYYRPSLLMLMITSACLLLLACANVANLQLARTAARGRDIAIRVTLGVGRLRLFRQLFLESLAVSLLGALLGLAVARWMVDLMMSKLPPAIRGYVPHYGEVAIDAPVLLFSLAVAVATATIFGFAPALRASRPDMHELLKEGGRSSGGVRRRRGRALLVVSEVALALTLLITTALMLRSFSRLQQTDPGFAPEHVLTAQLDLPEAVYAEPAQIAGFYDQVLQRVRAIPGVTEAAVIDHVPMGGSNVGGTVFIEGASYPSGEPPTAMIRAISPEYFRAMGIPLREGRAFSSRDAAAAPPVAIINEATARTFWPSGSALHKRVKRGGLESDTPWLEIVGVVGDVKHWSLDERRQMQLYLPLPQQPQRAMSLVVRTRGKPTSVAGAVRAAVLALDRNQPLGPFRTMEELVSDSLLMQRTSVLLLSFFGAIALLVGGVGIFSIIYYLTMQRTHEFGVRMALGASRGSVLQLVMRQGLRLTAVGLAIGVLLAFGLAQAISGLLYGVTSTDLVTYGAVASLLAAIALVATYLPARRASRVQPVVAIRNE